MANSNEDQTHLHIRLPAELRDRFFCFRDDGLMTNAGALKALLDTYEEKKNAKTAIEPTR